jgi:site-specific DNA-adenine methylase
MANVQSKLQSSKVTSPFCGQGSGRNLFTKLRKDIPPHDLYVEPYVGTGNMFFKLLNTNNDNIIINDKNKDLMDMYKILKNTKERTFRKDLNSIPKQEQFLRTSTNKDLDKFMKYILKYCNTFGSTGEGKLYKDTNPANKLKYLDRYQSSTDYPDIQLHYNSLDKVLNNIKGKFMLLVNDEPFTRKLFSKFNPKPISISKIQNKEDSQASKPRTELLITN